jgi:diadenosine tetraphosphatase ApaH/serine/threonine PP2A family protein phosphatase
MHVLVLSDVHANLAALEEVLKKAGEVDEVWYLGDIVGYGPDPNACVDRFRDLRPQYWLAGNHDWAALGKLDISDFNPMARLSALWTRQQLTRENFALLKKLPARVKASDQFTLAHGSPRHPIWEYVLDVQTAETNFAHFDTPYCLVGHTHVPAIYRLHNGQVEALAYTLGEPFELKKGRMIINPGGVGQPRDGDPRASYLILDTIALTVTYHRVEYPVEETQARMYKAGLPSRLITRLSYGW